MIEARFDLEGGNGFSCGVETGVRLSDMSSAAMTPELLSNSQ